MNKADYLLKNALYSGEVESFEFNGKIKKEIRFCNLLFSDIDIDNCIIVSSPDYEKGFYQPDMLKVSTDLKEKFQNKLNDF